MIFNDYAHYYNLLYRDKDYSKETEFVLDVFKKHGCIPKTLLDLGCGTGRHDTEFAKQGIEVTGVDLSQTMIDIGKENIKVSNAELLQGDVRDFKTNKKFDAAVSLFHVMSYQNTEEDAAALFKTAKEHLNPNGCFLFDFWYGPGVLTDPPVVREKIMEDDNIKAVRMATPLHKVNDNIVEVHYNVKLTDKTTKQENILNECHSMRYWFLPELRYLAKETGFSVIDEGAWLSFEKPAMNTWNVWMLASKNI